MTKIHIWRIYWAWLSWQKYAQWRTMSLSFNPMDKL